MPIQKWISLEENYVYKHNWFAVKTEACKLPNDTTINPYYTVVVPDWANVIICNTNNQLVMVKQYRHAAGIITIEPSGGLIDSNETPLDAAIREMKEETGYTSNNVQLISTTYPNPALQQTKAYFYLATNASLTSTQKFDEFEDIEIVHLSKQETLEMLANNAFANGVQVGAIYKAIHILGWI